MVCNTCGSTQFEEENGLFYCSFCQTQSQGFTQESGQDYVGSRLLIKKAAVKRSKQVVTRKSGVLWTTTEAFSLILFKQMNCIFAMNLQTVDPKDVKDLTQLIWSEYLRKSQLIWTTDESNQRQDVSRRLHPASRFRDIQILTNKVDKSLPPFKNGSTEVGFCQLFSLGSDGVIRTFKKSKTANDFMAKVSDEQNICEIFDIFNGRYRDPRKYTKIRSKGMKISKESRKQLRDILSKISLELSLKESEKFDDLDVENIKPEENIFKNDEPIDDNSRDQPKSKASVTSDDSIENNSFDDHFDRELLKNATEMTKLYSKYISLSYLKKSSNINSNYFIDLMSLPKTLSILNIVFRLLCYDIYCFDLIRWVNEGHIPYNNCLVCFPDDWVLIANDFHTFTSSCVPSLKTISILSAKIANYIGIKSFPRPNLEELLIRFAKDLNLPKDIVEVINANYDLLEHFPKEMNKMSKCRTAQQMPYYEVWTLMIILLVLKRIFILNDSSETFLTRYTQNETKLFIWDEWESYTRLRVELIRSYFIPSYPGDLADIRDVDLIGDYFFQMRENIPTLGVNKSSSFRLSEFREDIQQEFKEFLFDGTEGQSLESVPKPSLYPLTNATNFALNRINSSSLSQKMLVSFEDKQITRWTCPDGKAFHRGYQFLDDDQRKWSQSFKLLIYLSCFILNCKVETLIPILKRMEKRYFGKGND